MNKPGGMSRNQPPGYTVTFCLFYLMFTATKIVIVLDLFTNRARLPCSRALVVVSTGVRMAPDHLLLLYGPIAALTLA